MSKSLLNKTAVITGGASGIGYSIAKLFVENGAKVILLDINSDVDSIAKAISRENAFGLNVNLMDFESYDKILTEIFLLVDSVDILINNAGLIHLESALKTSLKNWDATLDLNLKSPFLLSQKIAPYMIERKKGKIVNLASQAALVALDEHLSYCVSKAGILSMTKVMASEWSKFGLQINSISPTVVMTDLGKKAWSGEKGKEMLKKIPAGKFADPIDIAELALFLCGDKSNMITGENIVLDGGYTIQ